VRNIGYVVYPTANENANQPQEIVAIDGIIQESTVLFRAVSKDEPSLILWASVSR